MTKRAWVIGVAVVLALGGLAIATRGQWFPQGAVAQAPSQTGPRAVPVDVAVAVRRMQPVRIEALGTVTPMRSVAVKSRLDSEITEVHFVDGAKVNEGDLLFTLDSRAIEAQIKQVQGVLASAKAQLEQAERDVARYLELVAKNATTQVTLSNAQTQVNVWRAAVESNTGQLENLRIQLTYCTIRARISGRASTATVKVGNVVRMADAAPLVIINQMAPAYVTFTVPQRSLPDIRQAIAAETATVEALIPGERRRATGVVSVIENSVDSATGMATIRATMPNADELLWPGTLVNAELTLRMEEAVSVPTVAVQVSQSGTFVFVVKDGVVSVRPVKVDRMVGSESILSSGLEGGETVVTDGQLQLTNGSRVSVRERKAGS
jgi:multidrug efflux system membrane fusion protein